MTKFTVYKERGAKFFKDVKIGSIIRYCGPIENKKQNLPRCRKVSEHEDEVLEKEYKGYRSPADPMGLVWLG
jgi:hypothetical protein